MQYTLQIVLSIIVPSTVPRPCTNVQTGPLREQFYIKSQYWNVMAHGDVWEWKWRGNWRMEWVASTLHSTSEHATIGSRGVRISGSNAGYTMFRGSVRVQATRSIRQFPLHFPSRASPCAITFQLDSTCSYSEQCQCTTRGTVRDSALRCEKLRKWIGNWPESRTVLVLWPSFSIVCRLIY